MKVATLKSFRSLHTWTGLVAGMALFIAFYAGSLTVFVHELQQWQSGADLHPIPSIDAAQPLLDEFLRQHPDGVQRFSLVLAGEHGAQHHILWFDGQTQQQFSLEPSQQLLQQPSRDDFVSFLYDLHFTAGLPRIAGTYLFGILCLLYGLALLSGVVIYSPVFFKDLFALRLGASIKRVWQDVHNLIGVLSLPFHVMFAWSGAVLTIGLLMLAPFQFVVFDGKLMGLVSPDLSVIPAKSAEHVSAPLQSISHLVARAEHAVPNLDVETLVYENALDKAATVIVYGHVADDKALTDSSAVALNGVSGELIKVQKPQDMSLGATFLRGLQSLHFARAC